MKYLKLKLYVTEFEKKILIFNFFILKWSILFV